MVVAPEPALDHGLAIARRVEGRMQARFKRVPGLEVQPREGLRGEEDGRGTVRGPARLLGGIRDRVGVPSPQIERHPPSDGPAVAREEARRVLLAIGKDRGVEEDEAFGDPAVQAGSRA